MNEKTYFGKDAFSHLKLLLKNAFASKSHTHTKSEITDYTDYELPTASSDTLGGVKVGAGLAINSGVLSATGGGTSSGDTPIEGAIDQNLWNTFFKINKYAGNSVSNVNPTLTFSGTSTGALIANLSEEEATYAYGASVSHVATTLDAGKTLSVEVELETTNVSVCNMGFMYGTGSYADLIATNGQSGTYTVSISNTTDSTININGIACMIDVADTSGYTLKMTIKSITIS